MKRNKIFSILMILVIMLGTVVTTSSCGKDDETDSHDLNHNEKGEDDNNDNNDTVDELIKKNISATVSYGDYSWNISIQTKLSNIFPDKTIIYGVESGYGYYKYYEHFKFDDDNQKNDGKGNIVVCYPVFVGSEYAEESMYWDSYKVLKTKKATYGLTSDEKELYNSCVTYMNEKEYKAKSTFCGRLYAQIDDERYFFYAFDQEVVSDTPLAGIYSCPDNHHPHAIDLGLPSKTKWCCCNVGAILPEDFGGYYAWGETSEKSYYHWTNYAFWQYDGGDRYFYRDNEFIHIGSDISGTKYDVAHVKMSNSWRMPTYNQIKELDENCTLDWTQQNGINGILVTGPNGNQIFIPAAGRIIEETSAFIGETGYYWSSSLSSKSESSSPVFQFYVPKDRYYVQSYFTDYERGIGASVRAVCP